uniref:Uncharacterized protein n=1 Tax=uncultured marine virus TaxID=186617 RepID=A0A0F7L7Z7_9VIRU|nr:hypothetical protein [uncultured marine virus]
MIYTFLASYYRLYLFQRSQSLDLLLGGKIKLCSSHSLKRNYQLLLRNYSSLIYKAHHLDRSKIFLFAHFLSDLVRLRTKEH